MQRDHARLWDFPSALLLIFIMIIASQRLYITHWTTGLGTATLLAAISVVLGLALGYTEFKPAAVFGLAFGYSISVTLLVLGGVLYVGITWLERVADLYDRLSYALGLLFNNQPVQDTILFVVVMALLFWIIGVTAGYAMTRFGNFIAAVIPAGVVLVIIQLYDSNNANSDAFLAIYITLCLLLLGRLTYVRRIHFWNEHRVATLVESRTYLNFLLVGAALATVLLVWWAPTSVKSFSHLKTAWENLTQPWRKVQKSLGNAVAGIQVTKNITPVAFFGDILPLSNQAATGEGAYLKIETPLVNNTNRFYWRVRSYNIFQNDQWYAEGASSTYLSSDQPQLTLVNPQGVTDKFIFTSYSANLMDLVTPARPVWVSHGSRLFFFQDSAGGMDPIQFISNPPLQAGETYTIRANENDPTILQLRSAGNSYPAWVTRRYLQLPGSLSPEIIALAQSITAQDATPYDMADAITNYLRNYFTYSASVENPPRGLDPLDWFLLHSRRGFCNYFATAEVVMLRVVGVPSRLVVGFAQGEYQTPDFYVIRQKDSHAWPEVYFPDIGWVEFEPTANQPPLERPQGGNPASNPQAELEKPLHGITNDHTPVVPIAMKGKSLSQELAASRFFQFTIRLLFIILVVVTIYGLYIFGSFDRFLNLSLLESPGALPVLLRNFLQKRSMSPPAWLLRWAYVAELNPIERSFQIVYRSLRWLGAEAPPSQTPAEAANRLAGLLPGVSGEIYLLLDEYQRHLYSHRYGLIPVARRAMRTIQKEARHVAIQHRWSNFESIFLR